MSDSGNDVFSKFNFPGGFPNSKDLAPSIVFLIAYVIATPLLIYRLVKKETRCIPLIRPAIFLLARYIMLVLRAIMSKNNYGENELIAELIVTSIGTLFLVEPIVELWKRNVASAVQKDVAPKWVKKIALVLQLGVMGAIITAIISSAKISDAINDPSELSTVMTLKKASACLTLAVVVITAAAALLTHVTFGLAARNTAFIVGCELCLAVISIYRLVQTFSMDPTTAVHKPVVFWICQMVFEFIVFVALIAIPIPSWFPSEKTLASRDAENIVPVDNTKYGGGYPAQQGPQYPPRPYGGNSQA